MIAVYLRRIIEVDDVMKTLLSLLLQNYATYHPTFRYSHSHIFVGEGKMAGRRTLNELVVKCLCNFFGFHRLRP